MKEELADMLKKYDVVVCIPHGCVAADPEEFARLVKGCEYFSGIHAKYYYRRKK